MRSVLAVACLLALAAGPVAAQGDGLRDDTTPPEIQSVSFDRSTYGPGDEVVATILVEDESELEYASVSLRDSQSPLYIFERQCSRPAGAHPASVTCRLLLPDLAPAGRYVVNQVQARDAIGHTTSRYGASLPPFDQVGFQVDSPYTDRQPPVLSDLSLDRAVVAAGGTAVAQFRASDASGIVRGGIGLRGPTSATHLHGECEVSAGDWMACPIAVPAGQPRGLYTVSFIHAEDRVGYNAFAEERYGQLPSTTLQVESDVEDADAPRLLGIDMPDAPVPRGSPYSVRLSTSDATGVASRGVVRMQTVHGNALLDTRECLPSASVLGCTGVVPPRYPQGQVKLEMAYLTDTIGNGGHYFAPWSLGCPTCFRLEERAPYEMRFLVGPAPLAMADDLPAPVRALDPFFPDVAPGHVLPVVVQAAEEDVASVVFGFRGAAGDAAGQVLAVAGCEPGADPTVIGSLCHLIVPGDALPGEYLLDEVSVVEAGGGRRGLAFDTSQAPGFTVSPDAGSPAFALPAAWQDQVVSGVTRATFNSEAGNYEMPALVDAAPRSAPASSGPASDASGSVSPSDDPGADAPASDPPASEGPGRPVQDLPRPQVPAADGPDARAAPEDGAPTPVDPVALHERELVPARPAPASTLLPAGLLGLAALLRRRASRP